MYQEGCLIYSLRAGHVVQHGTSCHQLPLPIKPAIFLSVAMSALQHHSFTIALLSCEHQKPCQQQGIVTDLQKAYLSFVQQ